MKCASTAPWACGLIVIVLAACWGTTRVDAAPTPATAANLKANAEAFAHVARRPSGRVTFLGTSPGTPFSDTAPAATIDGRARAFVQSNRGLFVDDALPLDLVSTPITDAPVAGISHVRFQQQLLGVPVRGAFVDVHLNSNGITAVSSSLLSPTFIPSADPLVTAADAQQTARAAVLAKYGPLEVTLTGAELEFFDPTWGSVESEPPVLAWYFEALGEALREQIWIDATSGAVAKIQSRLTDARNRRTFDANSTAIVPTTPARTEAQGNTGITDVDRAHDFAGDFYNYYFSEHGRDSFDGNGATIDSVVRLCPTGSSCPYRNAFWNGARISFGAGFTVDDVVGHELTHAVIERSSNLDYLNEPGAMNESFADIFGETIDLGNGKGNDAANQRWIIGEDIPGVTGGIRSLMSPGNFGDPARVKDSTYYCGTTDNGGVHTNSGVPNHAYALMVDGGMYNGYTMTGIGLTKAAKIQYRAMTGYLTKQSTFLSDFNALIQSCSDLIGTSGITYADCAQVKKALLAVEMSTKPCSTAVPPALPPATPVALPATTAQCPTGQVAAYVFQDDFEITNSGKWSTAALVGPNQWTAGNNGAPAIYATGNAASGTYSLHATPATVAGDSYVISASALVIPAAATLQFDNAYDFEGGIDGGVVEFSVNSGVSWSDVSPLFKTGRGYNAGLVNGLSNPLGGRTAFSGSAPQYATTRADLATLAGKNVLFRFRVGSDSSVAAPGWWVDNVAIYTCGSPTPGVTVTPISGVQVSETQSSTPFTLVLKSAPSSNVSINLSSSDPSEGTVAPTSMVFTPQNWNVAQTAMVTGVDDDIDDDNVAFSVVTEPAVSGDPSYNGLNPSDVSATTIDDDTAGVTFTRTSGLVTTEGGTSDSTQVSLSSAPIATVTLNFSSSNPAEGSVAPSSITFTSADWNVARTVTVSGVDDAVVDGNVAYSVVASVATTDTKYSVITLPPIPVTNNDNDQAGFSITSNGGVVTSESGTSATFSLVIATKPKANVTVNLRSSDASEGSVAPTSVTFTPDNWNQPAVITVTGVDDSIADGNVTFQVVTDPASSSDAAYNGVNPPDVNAQNIDNEIPKFVVVAADGLSTTEGGGTATFTIALATQPSDDVVVDLHSSDLTEGTVAPTRVTLTPANWNQLVVVTVTGVDDSIADTDVDYAIVFSAAVSLDPNYSGRVITPVLLKNINNDAVTNAQPTRLSALVVLSGASRLRTTEGGGSASFTVKLNKPPKADVTIRVTTSNPAEGRPNTRELVFTPTNSDQPQTITVVGRDDSKPDGNVTYMVTLNSPVSADPDFNGIEKMDIPVVNEDDDKKSAGGGALDGVGLLISGAFLGWRRRRNLSV